MSWLVESTLVTRYPSQVYSAMAASFFANTLSAIRSCNVQHRLARTRLRANFPMGSNLEARFGVYTGMKAFTIGADEAQGPGFGSGVDDFTDYVCARGRQHKRLAFLLTGDLHQAEDLLQAAYAKVYPRWSKVRTYDVPDAYLRRVMVSLRTSWWRRSRGRESVTADLSGLTEDAVDPVAEFVESQTLLAALKQLPDRQRAAVVLRHWCDLSEAEVAATMDCSIGTVKSNTSRGLAHLRGALGLHNGEAS